MIGETNMTSQVNVLVVEDRRDWQEIICDAVSDQGYIPHAVTTYKDALDLLNQRKFDMATIDPVLDAENRFNRDGLSVIQKIDQIQLGIPIVVITGDLTQDLKDSLQHLRPQASVLFKDSWDGLEFSTILKSLQEKAKATSTKGEFSDSSNQSEGLTTPTPPSIHRAVNRPRILVVENRLDWQEIVTQVLDEANYFWRVAHNAQEALQEIEKENFHLVILDLKLQANDLPLRSNEGWLLLDFLVESRPNTKVVVLSGQAGPSDVANLLTHYPIIRFIEKEKFTDQIIKDVVAEATKAPELRIQTFGQFRLWRAGHAVEVWEYRQAETLVKLLLVKRAREERAVSANELITRLWPDDDEENGRKKLQPLISNARRTIEPDIEPRDSNFILRSANGYFFDISGPVTWDLLEFWEHLRVGRELIEEKNWDEAIAELQAGRNLYRGDFLSEDRYADWAIELQREVTNDFRDLLILLADAYTALSHYDKAVEACQFALRKDPLLESVYRRLMGLHYCQGQKAQALKVYRDCIKLFEELFGESPTPATRQLHQAISNDEDFDCPPEVR